MSNKVKIRLAKSIALKKGVPEWRDGWRVDDGGKTHFNDCLQQSKILYIQGKYTCNLKLNISKWTLCCVRISKEYYRKVNLKCAR